MCLHPQGQRFKVCLKETGVLLLLCPVQPAAQELYVWHYWRDGLRQIGATGHLERTTGSQSLVLYMQLAFQQRLATPVLKDGAFPDNMIETYGRRVPQECKRGPD